jgi:hypothetical protein
MNYGVGSPFVSMLIASSMKSIQHKTGRKIEFEAVESPYPYGEATSVAISRIGAILFDV